MNVSATINAMSFLKDITQRPEGPATDLQFPCEDRGGLKEEKSWCHMASYQQVQCNLVCTSQRHPQGQNIFFMQNKDMSENYKSAITEKIFIKDNNALFLKTFYCISFEIRLSVPKKLLG